MIRALIGQCNWTVYASCLSNWTVRVRARALMDQLHLNRFLKTVVYSLSGTFSPFSFSNFVIDMINW